MIVMKRDGREDHYSKTKIFNAINKAVKEVTKGEGDELLATKITTRLESRYRKRNRAISVEEIQDDIETELMKEQAFDIAKAYITVPFCNISSRLTKQQLCSCCTK